ncbi:MAG: glycosyltransferase family 39 protein [Acidobacteria bacterium]|nr:glycosyltransferase family 39 protein [Acidobacteriota bacterium]
MTRTGRVLAIMVLGAALAFRLWWAIALPCDAPGDTVLYERFAVNLLQHDVYSGEEGPPYSPSYIRTPGYPLFLAGVYSIFGVGNDVAVRASQAVLDTSTCLLVALLALSWCPLGWDQRRKGRAFFAALILAAACPMVALYVGTVLSETLTLFFGTACILAASYALKAEGRRAAAWWAACGVLGGMATMVRPDSGLLLSAAGGAMGLRALASAWTKRRQPGIARGELRAAVFQGAVLSLAFAATLAPWTIRNAKLFDTFMPLSPEHAQMPGEFVPYGYLAWVKSWISDQRYIESFLWEIDTQPLRIAELPASACDSPQERERVAALFALVNPPCTGASAAAAKPNGNDDAKETEEPSAGATITPAADAQFMALARERARRHPFRTHIILPAKRAVAMWFDTHSAYTPFDGELFPLASLDWESLQPLWLLLFMALVWLHTILGGLGVWKLWRETESRVWVLLIVLLIVPRVAFFATIENPEPRYLVELFPFTSAASGVALAWILSRRASGN